MKKIIISSAIGAAMLLAVSQAQANNTFGIDLSSFQGSPNWSSVKANGAYFAFAKATEGNYYRDADFVSNMNNGKAAGVRMAAYHFARPDTTCPSVQASYFYSFAGGYTIADKKSIQPMLDFETYNGVACSEGTYTAWCNDFQTDFQTHVSWKVYMQLYTSACAGACDLIEYNDAGGIALGAFIADYDGENLYTGNPWGSCDCCNMWIVGCGTGGWTYWQVCSNGSIGGVSGACDFDAYVGTVAELDTWQGIGGE